MNSTTVAEFFQDLEHRLFSILNDQSLWGSDSQQKRNEAIQKLLHTSERDLLTTLDTHNSVIFGMIVSNNHNQANTDRRYYRSENDGRQYRRGGFNQPNFYRSNERIRQTHPRQSPAYTYSYKF